MSSSPTIICSSVDFPDPDGPTRITNSPSAISRLTSSPAGLSEPNRLVTFWIAIALIDVLSLPAFYGPAREPGDDPPLEEQDDDHHGDRHDHGRGRDRGRRLVELRRAAEERERRRHGARLVGGGQ